MVQIKPYTKPLSLFVHYRITVLGSEPVHAYPKMQKTSCRQQTSETWYGNLHNMRVRSAVPSRPAPRPAQPPVQWVQGLPRGKAAAAWCWSPTFFQMPGCQWVRATPPPPLCASMGMSWGDLYLYVETRFSLHLRNEFYNEWPSMSSSFDSF
jgi:hypothetical protein